MRVHGMRRGTISVLLVALLAALCVTGAAARKGGEKWGNKKDCDKGKGKHGHGGHHHQGFAEDVVHAAKEMFGGGHEEEWHGKDGHEEWHDKDGHGWDKKHPGKKHPGKHKHDEVDDEKERWMDEHHDEWDSEKEEWHGKGGHKWGKKHPDEHKHDKAGSWAEEKERWREEKARWHDEEEHEEGWDGEGDGGGGAWEDIRGWAEHHGVYNFKGAIALASALSALALAFVAALRCCHARRNGRAPQALPCDTPPSPQKPPSAPHEPLHGTVLSKPAPAPEKAGVAEGVPAQGVPAEGVPAPAVPPVVMVTVSAGAA